MPDGQTMSSFTLDSFTPPAPTGYIPPASLILRGLGTNELAFAEARVSVSATFLRFLIGEIARRLPFDAAYYAEAYPDVEAARLAGDVASLQDHFIEQGYFERRRPHDLPFDSFYYATKYDDLAEAYRPSDSAALRAHFTGHGWEEGRVAVSWQRRDADRWVAAARAGEP